MTATTGTVQVWHKDRDFSRRLKDEFDNGKEYYTLQGKTILLPGNPLFRPSTEQLAWHNDHVYRPYERNHPLLKLHCRDLCVIISRLAQPCKRRLSFFKRVI